MGEKQNLMRNEQMRWQPLVERIVPGGQLLRSWRLEGGVSAEATALDILATDGHRKRLVVRRHGERDWRRDPEVAAKEFVLLSVLHKQGMQVPIPYEAGGRGGTEETPYIVVEFVEGSSGMDETGNPESIRQLAEELAKLHSIEAAVLQEKCQLERQEKRVAKILAQKPANLDESLDEGIIRRMLEAQWPPASGNPDVVLHGDYWPGNTMWRDGSLVSVIDWEDAAIGDPMADLANARLELAWAFGEDATESFTARYRELMPALSDSSLPLWELVAALRPASRLQDWGLERETEDRMREIHKRFVKRALQHLV